MSSVHGLLQGTHYSCMWPYLLLRVSLLDRRNKHVLDIHIKVVGSNLSRKIPKSLKIKIVTTPRTRKHVTTWVSLYRHFLYMNVFLKCFKIPHYVWFRKYAQTSSNQSITGRLLWTELLILYTYNFILSIKALNTTAKFDIEKHLGQEACQCTCSIFFFVEKFL